MADLVPSPGQLTVSKISSPAMKNRTRPLPFALVYAGRVSAKALSMFSVRGNQVTTVSRLKDGQSSWRGPLGCSSHRRTTATQKDEN